jgi:serine/threonine protein kinase
MTPADEEAEDFALECHARLHQGQSAAIPLVCRERPELIPIVRRRLAAMLRREGTLTRLVRAESSDAASQYGGPRSDPVPDRIGPYPVVRLLGRGGMAAVYLAEAPQLGRQVALKVLLPGTAADPHTAARFLREVRMSAALDHPNLMPALGLGEADGFRFMVMPYLPGETLGDRMNRGPIQPDEVLRLGADIARGLAAAHEFGIVHRDLKPANVWLEADSGRARVFDFGLARPAGEAERLTAAGTFLGTLRYAAPEQALDAATADARSDLYSLGLILHEAATGRLPAGRESLADLLDGTAVVPAREPLDAVGLPAPAVELILRLLHPDPACRPAPAAAVLAELTSG